MILTTSSGRSVTIKELIAQGGEGAVFRTEQPTLVAKLYHTKPSKGLAEKLASMVHGQSKELLRLACWPVEVLFDPAGRDVKGFLMPCAAGYKELHTLAGPKSRASEFKSVDWRFLVSAAANIARAFATIHAKGHVIGDVNEKGVFVAQDSTVKLIDCDSFQVRLDGKQFACAVGTPLFTPPELQGQRLDQVVRTFNHDAFGLAVLIFELLFMGRHPYAGRYLGYGDPSLEGKIGKYLFAYGKDAKSRLVEQPPHTLSLSDVPLPVANAFERAFTQLGALGTRPTAAEWVGLLDQMQRELKPCPNSAGHWYHPVAASCPWCAIETQVGISLFSFAFAPVAGDPNFNLAMVWASIDKVPPPPSISFSPAQSVQPLPPSPHAARLRSHRLGLRIIAVAFLLVIAQAVLLDPGLLCGAIAVAALLWVVVSGLGTSMSAEAKRKVEEQLQEALYRYDQLYRQWSSTAAREVFDRAKNDLANKKNQYQGMNSFRQKELQTLHNTIREKQLERYLDQFRIDRARIPNIGAGRCAVLRSNGIETAADISWLRVSNVQGFGASLADNLIRWRQGKERQFRFDPSKGVDPRDIAALDQRIAQMKRTLESDLTRGPNELLQLATRIQTARTMQEGPLREATRHLAQLRGDLAAL